MLSIQCTLQGQIQGVVDFTCPLFSPPFVSPLLFKAVVYNAKLTKVTVLLSFRVHDFWETSPTNSLTNYPLPKIPDLPPLYYSNCSDDKCCHRKCSRILSRRLFGGRSSLEIPNIIIISVNYSFSHHAMAQSFSGLCPLIHHHWGCL